ncbi:MAG: hypothetical protein A3G41_07505 [Elusimicrobia bacterium RIFCSPLOWO2_12_FULL_59_9]|nr:MAG: hypothetical protein A3G41_07505 [Elusimicrobia bacterium RIFCSPLOWO2_12_FULL_59_9]
MRAAAAIIAGAGLFFFTLHASAFDIAVTHHLLTEKVESKVDADNVEFLENEAALAVIEAKASYKDAAGCGYTKQAFLQAEAPSPGVGGYEPFLYEMKKAAGSLGGNVLVLGNAFTYQETKLYKYLTATAYRMECGGELLPGKFVEPSSTTWTLRGFKKTEEGDNAPLALPGMLPEPSPPKPQPASPPPQPVQAPQSSDSMAAFYNDFIALDEARMLAKFRRLSKPERQEFLDYIIQTKARVEKKEGLFGTQTKLILNEDLSKQDRYKLRTFLLQQAEFYKIE